LPYRLRNTLILLAFVVIILIIGGFFNFYHYPKKIKRSKSEIQNIDAKLVSLPEMETALLAYKTQIETNRQKLSQLDKQIEPKVTPALTYGYLDSVQDKFGSLQGNIAFDGDSVAQGYGYNIFSIKGEGEYDTIYAFIWALEEGPKVYRIVKLNLRSVESVNEETGLNEIIVVYDLDLWALYADVKNLPPINRRLADVRPPIAYINPFEPYVFKDIPPNIYGLLEVERADLQALYPDKAFIADNKGQIQILTLGDEVYLGYLTKIDTQNNQVEFTLNKGGIIEKFYLKMAFGRKE
jgi:hypothetical protein